MEIALSREFFDRFQLDYIDHKIEDGNLFGLVMKKKKKSNKKKRKKKGY
jgi:hypothetical protein